MIKALSESSATTTFLRHVNSDPAPRAHRCVEPVESLIRLHVRLAPPRTMVRRIRCHSVSGVGKDREVTMGKITIFARMGVKPENVEQLKALATAGCKVVADEPGTLSYDWGYSEAEGSLILLETYADSTAHFSHMQADGHNKFMGSIMSMIDSMEFFVLGNPTAEHVEALGAVPGAKFYSEFAKM